MGRWLCYAEFCIAWISPRSIQKSKQRADHSGGPGTAPSFPRWSFVAVHKSRGIELDAQEGTGNGWPRRFSPALGDAAYNTPVCARNHVARALSTTRRMLTIRTWPPSE